jgi:hypothetical protein
LSLIGNGCMLFNTELSLSVHPCPIPPISNRARARALVFLNFLVCPPGENQDFAPGIGGKGTTFQAPCQRDKTRSFSLFGRGLDPTGKPETWGTSPQQSAIGAKQSQQSGCGSETITGWSV